MDNHGDWDDKKLDDTLTMVEGHLDSHYEKLNGIVGFTFHEKLKETITSIIVKTNQSVELRNEITLRKLKSSFEQLSFRSKMSVYLIKPKMWIKELFKGLNDEKIS